jgi:predicted secreted protein
VTCDLFWIADPSQVALQDAYEAAETTNFRVVLPDAGGTTYQFAAFVTNLSWDLPVDDAIKRSLTLKISGPVTEVP